MTSELSPITGLRILLVEDEYFIADDMRRWLEEAGAVVVGPVPSVRQALTIIDTEAALDLAVLDMNLGGQETAYPIADRLGEAGVPFLFATGDVRTTDVPDYANRPRLAKPVLKSDLLALLQRLVSNSSPAPMT